VTVAFGYLIAAAIAVVAIWIVAGRNFVCQRDSSVNLSDIAGKHVGIMSGLSGYAVTGMVLLVTLGRSISDPSSTTYTTVVTMFFISWMAFAGTAFLYANVSDHDPDARREPRHGFDVPAAQFAGAAGTLEVAFSMGWLALRPLFQAFGLERLADIAAPILVVVAFASYALVAHHLHRSGYGPARIVVAIGAFAALATLAYAAIAGVFGLRTEDATLDVIVVGFSVGVFAFSGFIVLNILGAYERTATYLARFGSYIVVAYVQSVVVLVGFILLGVLGLA
jgi:hypothetical protein